MKNNTSFIYAIGLIIGDFCALLAAFVIAYVLRVTLDERSLINPIDSDQYLKTWIFIIPIWIIIFAFLGLYRRTVYEYRWRELSMILVGSVLGIMTVITYDFIVDTPVFPARLIVVYGLIIGFLLLVLERTILRATRMWMWRTGFGINNIMLIGGGDSLHNLINSMKYPSKTGYKVTIVATKDTIVGKKPFKIFSDYRLAMNEALNQNIFTIVVTGIGDASKEANEILAFAQSHHIAYKFIPSQAGMLNNKIDVELFQGLPVVSVHQTALIGWGRVIKRLFDVITSIISLIILSPIYIIIAIAVKLSDGGPIFFKQSRLSRFDTTIKIYKFRTHNLTYNGLDPEQAFNKMGKPQLIKKYRDNGDYLANDPRITKIGLFLRRTSLDELPQLFNVLKGDISLVGPRALVPKELNNYAYKNLILSVKSGITGLAQTSGRKNIGYNERRALDLYYVQNWSFWLDIKILFYTVIEVLSGRGAK